MAQKSSSGTFEGDVNREGDQHRPERRIVCNVVCNHHSPSIYAICHKGVRICTAPTLNLITTTATGGSTSMGRAMRGVWRYSMYMPDNIHEIA